MLPPPAWPNSGLNPLVSTWNSVIASSDGVRNAVSVRVGLAIGVDRDAVERRAERTALAAAERVAGAAASRLRNCGEQVERAAHRSADDERKLIDHAVRHRRGNLGVFGLNRGVLRDDVDRLRHGAEVQRDVDTRCRAGVESDAFDDSRSGNP